MEMEGAWTAQVGTENKYQYNGIERNEDFGLNADLAFFRSYEPALGRWWQIDPKGESMYSMSLYSGMMNNPIRFNDPRGDCPPGVDCGDPVPNPRISNDNRLKEKSNRFRSIRINREGRKRLHYGLDILAKKGTRINSILAGKIHSVKNNDKTGTGLGNRIVIESELPNGSNAYIIYAHLSPDSKSLGLSKGDNVNIGDQVGIGGNTGNASKIDDEFHHVHIEVFIGEDFSSAKRVDPEDFIKTQFDSEGQPVPEKEEQPNYEKMFPIKPAALMERDGLADKRVIDPRLSSKLNKE